MVAVRLVLVMAVLAGVAGAGRAVDRVVLELPERVAVRSTVVTIADVARLSGGDPATRDRVGRLDLAEIKPREESVTITRRVIEYRLQLAGLDPHQFQVTGAARTTAVLARRAVTADEVVAAAREELLRRLALPVDSVIVELIRPLAVKLPEVPAGEPVTITAQPHGPLTARGRTQMDVAIACNGQKLLSLSVQFEVKSVDAAPAANVVPAAATAPGTPAPVAPATSQAGPPLVRTRQRVAMQVRSGELVVTAVGEAQQEGRLGQTILVQNVDSKKMVSARVTGPGTVEIDLPGAK